MVRKRTDTDVKTEMYERVKWLYGLFIVLGIGVIVRLLWVLFFSAEVAYNAERLEQKIFIPDSVYSRRGSILARNGEPLATSLLRYRVDFDMASEGFDSLALYKEQVDTLSKLLSAFFKDRTAAEYSRDMIKAHNDHYKVVFRKDTNVLRSEGFFARVWDMLRKDEWMTVKLYDTIRDHKPVAILPREVDYNEWQTLKKYPILNWNLGMTYRLETTDERVYPYNELGRRTLGLIGDRGNYGIEAYYRDILEGTDGYNVRQRIAPGFSTVVHHKDNVDAEDGLDIVTSLDVEIQHIADAALRRQMTAQNAIWGTAMVMEVETGDMLALVNLGETKERSGVYYEKENYAFKRRIEPGSTFKLAAALALVEDCGHKLNYKHRTNKGRATKVGSATITDDHPIRLKDGTIVDTIDLKTAIAQSSNVYFAESIYENYKNDKKRYHKFLTEDLHLGQMLGFEAMEEAMPNIHDPKNWSGSTLPNMGYGYGFDIPPVRTLVLYNAIANGGRMVAPRLIKQVKRGDDVVQEFPTEVIDEAICSAESRSIIHEALLETARTGTTKAYFPDTTAYRVASKTGTANVAQDGYGGGAPYGAKYYLGTVVAYFPADKPKYTVQVSIHTNRNRGITYGGPLAGPVVRDIVRYIYFREEEWHREIAETTSEHYPSTVKGGSIANIRRVADKFSPRVSFTDRNGWGVARADTLRNIDVKTIEDNSLMPNVVGMGLKDALYILESRGLRVQISGKGTVRSQSIPAGRKIGAGASVSLSLR